MQIAVMGLDLIWMMMAMMEQQVGLVVAVAGVIVDGAEMRV